MRNKVEGPFTLCLQKQPLEVFYKNFYEKETPTQFFSSEYCEIFKNTYFEEHLPTAVSVFNLLLSTYC